MKVPDEHGGAVGNDLVRLELRGVTTEVSATAWQLTCGGVRAREHVCASFWTGRARLDSLGCGRA
jgi:hypothetical protein